MGGVSPRATSQIRALLGRVPGLAGVLGRIVDAREKRGRLPGQITLAAEPDVAAALVELLSARAIQAAGPGRVRIDLSRADAVCTDQLGVGLDELLYAVLDRAPRDPAAEGAALAAAVVRDLESLLADAQSDAARAFVGTEIERAASGSGECIRLAHDHGADCAIADVAALGRCIDAALAGGEPIRIANFAAQVLGDSKALARGDRLRRLGRALLDHHRPTFEAVYAVPGDISDRHALVRALEVNGIYRDHATLTAYCFGPLVYGKRNQIFDHVARHAALGEPVPLSLAQLRGAHVAELPADRVLVIENQTPFLDYVESLAGTACRELVVYSGGQASWAVIQLLRMVSRAGLPVFHTGDLDRSGVLILRSLEARLFAPVTPVAMDVATHRRYCDRGQPITERERTRLAELASLDPPGATLGDLLREIATTGVWIEQERFFAEAIVRESGQASPS